MCKFLLECRWFWPLAMVLALAWCSSSGAADKPKDEPKITGWIHVFGCPRASREDDTNNDIILIFANGQIAHLKQHDLSPETKVQLALALTMQGLNIIYDCGATS